MLRRFRPTRRDEGASAVEFALVMPILFMLVFGIFEFGVAFAQQLSISNGARQAARFAATSTPDTAGNPTSTCSTILQELKNASSTIGLNTAQVKMIVTIDSGGSACTWTPASGGGGSWTTGSAATRPCLSSGAGASVTVDAQYKGHLVIPLAVANPSLTLTSEGVYRCEYSS